MKGPRLLNKFLKSPDGELEGLVTHAQQLRRLQGLFQQLVSANMAKHCQVANYQKQQLTLSCESSAWATRANMEKSQLLKLLRDNDAFQTLTEIRIITRPTTQPIENKEKTKNIPMSQESANTISQMAESLSDPELGAALQRLARRKNN